MNQSTRYTIKLDHINLGKEEEEKPQLSLKFKINNFTKPRCQQKFLLSILLRQLSKKSHPTPMIIKSTYD